MGERYRELRVRIKKGRDSRPTLACIRADGSRTWSKVHPFFPVHDLTHYAVESVLGLGRAFFGLVAAGWELDSFARPEARRHLPAEAILAESIVGILDLERATGRLLPVEALNDALGDSLARHGHPPFRPVTAEELAAIRTVRGELNARWVDLEPGATLEVVFPAGPTDAAAAAT